MLTKIFKLPVMLVATMIGLMYLVARFANIFHLEYPFSAQTAILMFALGTLIILIAAYSFKKAKTTVNPMTPDESSHLVVVGLYRYSRNPMYIGFFLWLVAGVIFFKNPINLLFLPEFILLANKLYIKPEENALTSIFGNSFLAYKQNVRRWI